MRRRNVLGWLAIIQTVVLSSIWAYWGAMENFHEGWYSESLIYNLAMFAFQYLLVAGAFVFVGLASLRWRRLGLVLHGGLIVFAALFFSGATLSVLGLLIVLPLAVGGMLYFYGSPVPQAWARRLLIAVPLAIVLGVSIPQGLRVAGRMNDGDFGLRQVQGNGVSLAWAPRGPGWPDRGVTWEEARRICSHLSADGTELLETEQGLWRLPTVDELVRSMTHRGLNAGGTVAALEQGLKATYEARPDKETPLWDPHSKVIYYWTAEESRRDAARAYIVVYHGGVFDRRKTDGQDYLSFRAVRDEGGRNQ